MSTHYMHPIYSPHILHQEFSCSKCKWKGTGSEMRQEFLFLTDATELFCPECDSYLGFISEGDELEPAVHCQHNG